MAIAWWMDTGVLSKMVADIQLVVGTSQNYWTKPKIRENRPLILFHGLPIIMICGASLFLSTVVFGLELIHHYLRAKVKNGLNLGKEPSQSHIKSAGSKDSLGCEITKSKDAYKIERPPLSLPRIPNVKLAFLGDKPQRAQSPTLEYTRGGF